MCTLIDMQLYLLVRTNRRTRDTVKKNLYFLFSGQIESWDRQLIYVTKIDRFFKKINIESASA